MRNEQEMMELLLGMAREDERIRAVYMNGSRTNEKAPKDIFQDYDIVYVVQETASFLVNNAWLNRFGELLLLQEPDKRERLSGMNRNHEKNYGYLMLFKDGNRIDLHVQTKEAMLQEYGQDSLTVPLLDKDGIFPELPPPSDSDYYIQVPSELVFQSCCNNFWWCLQNVAKGIWRDELPYAKEMFESVVREDLNQMVCWWIGIRYSFQISAGKMGKYFKTLLPQGYYHTYTETYADGDYERLWSAVFTACSLFSTLAQEAANHLGYSYNKEEEENMTGYLKHIRLLPQDAKEIFPT